MCWMREDKVVGRGIKVKELHNNSDTNLARNNGVFDRQQQLFWVPQNTAKGAKEDGGGVKGAPLRR